MGWNCGTCRKPLAISKGILDRGGIVKCKCGQEIQVGKKKNGKITICQKGGRQ